MAARARHSLIRTALAVLAAAAIALAAVTRIEQARQLPLPPILRVGIDPGAPPFAWLEVETLLGIDPALAQAIGDQIGVPVAFELLGFDGVYDALAADRVDVVLAALPIDSARRDRVHYTPPYFNAGLVLVSDARTPLNGMPDLAGRRLALEYGSTAQTEAARWLRRIPPFELRPYERASIALDAVRVGEADAALVDAVSARLYDARLYEQTHPAWSSSHVIITVVPLAAALRADRPRLAQAVDAAMETLANNGALERLIQSALERTGGGL